MSFRTVHLAALTLLAVVACQRNQVRPGPTPPPAPLGVAPVPFPGATPIAPAAPVGLPPAGLPPVAPVPSGYPPTQTAPPPYAPPQQSNFGPTAPPDAAAKAPVTLNPPEQAQSQGPPPQNGKADALPDTPPEPPTAEPPPVKAEKKAPDADAALPVGIPQFTVALPAGVTNGLRPALDGGLDWLQKKGYKTVLHLRLPEEADAADRKQVEKRGMAYRSLEVSPGTLSDKVVEEFARIVSDKSNYPLFVYDKDGSLAGGMWYLYFRSMEEEEIARVRANTLGLRTSGDGPHYEMWLAIQKYLSEKRP